MGTPRWQQDTSRRLSGAKPSQSRRTKNTRPTTTPAAARQNELQGHARIEAKEYPDLSGYDTVFLGYPNWWGTVPMVVDTFLRHYGDWSGRRVFPFCTNEGSGLGRSMSLVKEACPGATVENGLSIEGNKTGQSQKRIEKWAKDCL